jgi:nitrous oxide reductase accessory protein NosL
MGKKTVGRESAGPVQQMQNCEEISQHLLTKILRFWEANAQYVDKKGAFKESELETIQQELKNYSKYFKLLQYSEP